MEYQINLPPLPPESPEEMKSRIRQREFSRWWREVQRLRSWPIPASEFQVEED